MKEEDDILRPSADIMWSGNQVGPVMLLILDGVHVRSNLSYSYLFKAFCCPFLRAQHVLRYLLISHVSSWSSPYSKLVDFFLLSLEIVN